jgi:hypothetical protein
MNARRARHRRNPGDAYWMSTNPHSNLVQKSMTLFDKAAVAIPLASEPNPQPIQRQPSCKIGHKYKRYLRPK